MSVRVAIGVLALAGAGCGTRTGEVEHPRIPPKTWVLGPLYGSVCPDVGCAAGESTASGSTLAQLDRLALADIPVTGFHFDGPGWALPDTTCTWRLGDAVPARLRQMGIPALLHFWGGCETDADFARVHGQLGELLGGFYLDWGAEDPLVFRTNDWVARNLPDRGEVVLKAFSTARGWPPVIATDATLAAIGHTAYVDDLPTDFEGMREGIRRVFAKSALLGTFNELTGFGAEVPDEETLFRRIHWGALQLVMDHSPWVNTDPWDHGYSPELLRSYRDHAWVHLELVPYLHSYDWRAHEGHEPVMRGCDPGRYTTLLGDELFVAYVVEPGVRSMTIDLPPGEWIDRWDEAHVLSGTVVQAVPLGREPVFFRNGAIVPLDVSRDYAGHGTASSAGSLTVLVYPSGASAFEYRDDGLGRWITLRAVQEADQLALTVSEWPSRPVIWRVARMAAKPAGVSASGTTTVVGVPGLPEGPSEEAVEAGSAAAWFYDPDRRTLVVKTPGSG